MEENTHIRKEYKEKETVNDIVRLGNRFVDNFILDENNPERNEISINAIKIIFNIVQNIRNEQFLKEKGTIEEPVQLKLFEEEFLTEHNTYAKFKIKNSKISNNKKRIEEAFEFLAKYKFGWYTSTNSQGKKIKTLGGLISNVSYSERGYSSFLVSSYWLEKLMNLTDGFNKMMHNLPYRTKSNKTIIFCIWLSKLKTDTGAVSLEYMNDFFNTNYKTANEFGKLFLKPIQKFLDKNSLQSFGFKVEGNKIYYNRYQLKTLNTNVTEETRNIQEEIYKISYYKKRHQLTENQVKKLNSFLLNKKKTPTINETQIKLFNKNLLELYTKAYENFKKEAEKKLTEYTGKEFMEIFQKHIIQVYPHTRYGKHYPEKYPKIID